jgi:hypothetical protein
MEPRQAALLRQIRGPAAVQQNFLRSVLPRAEKDRGAIRTPQATPQATPEADEAAPARVGRGIRGVPYYPVRQSLGAVLLQAGRPMQAERMFHEALREHPNSAWAPGHSSVSRRRNGRKATRQPRPQRSGSSIPSGRATAGKLRYRCCSRAFGESPIRTRKPDCDATMSSSLCAYLKQAQSDVVTQLFISYSHADNALRKRLEIHLTILKRQGVIRMWNDLAIEPGKPWEKEILENLQKPIIVSSSGQR